MASCDRLRAWPRRASSEQCEIVSETREQWHRRLRRRLKRAWRQRLAKLWHYAYRIRHKASQYHARYRTAVGGAATVLLVAGTVYLLPAVQRGLEIRFATDEGVIARFVRRITPRSKLAFWNASTPHLRSVNRCFMP